MSLADADAPPIRTDEWASGPSGASATGAEADPAGVARDLAASAERPPIAFYAPLKSPHHPTPSGDRRMARLFLSALSRAGFAPHLASEYRSFLAEPSEAAFTARATEGLEEAERLIQRYDAAPLARKPRLWFTYHVYYKAPDLLGPRVAGALGIPYVVAEATRAAKRRDGPWAESAADAEAAIDLADVIFCLTDRDRPALETALDPTQALVDLPPFLDPPPAPPLKGPLLWPARLLAVAMMRPGDKLASYRTLAAALSAPSAPPMESWTLDIVGDGPREASVRDLFAPFGDRVRFRGRLGEAELNQAYSEADLLVWPGVGEAFGMAYLEARALGTPVLAEDRPGVRSVLGDDGFRAPPDDATAFGAALAQALWDPVELRARGQAARAGVLARHSLSAAADTLSAALAHRLETPRGAATALGACALSPQRPRRSAS